MVAEKTSLPDIKPYTTADGSTIRELMYPAKHGNKNQSLAEATVLVGCTTLLHKHAVSEELYHVTQGIGEMTLGEKRIQLRAGDTVCILPGTAHQIKNIGNIDLKILCCCSPPYSHADTELIEL
ncbi:MAG: cupin domain-containing protein [Pseudomonadota bacterium]|nr:cupin domain-containing protein [Pseudomonadota bacterium]